MIDSLCLMLSFSCQKLFMNFALILLSFENLSPLNQLVLGYYQLYSQGLGCLISYIVMHGMESFLLRQNFFKIFLFLEYQNLFLSIRNYLILFNNHLGFVYFLIVIKLFFLLPRLNYLFSFFLYFKNLIILVKLLLIHILYEFQIFFLLKVCPLF